MKKIILSILSFLFIALNIQAQEVPDAFKYQTVIRDAAGEILGNQAVRIGIDINQNNTPIYSEDHEVTTNAYGLVSLEIGRGIIVGGIWEDIDWSTPTSIRILLDPTGGNNLEVIGSSELLSVPYALQAGNAGGSSSWSEEGDNISNDNSGNVGIGTSTPDRKLSVSTDAAADGVMTVNNESGEGFAGTYFNSEGGLKGYVGYVGSGNWVEPNSFQLGGFNSDIKFLTTNQYATAPMTISNANQSVGIGTNAPDRKLSVSTDAAADGVMTVNNESGEGFAGTYFNSEGGLKGYVGYVGSGNWVEPNSFQLGGFNSDIKFLTTNQYATAPMTISNANQSVGIGTNAPDRKLSVSTDAAADGVMTVNNESGEGFAGTYFNSEGGLKGYVGYVGSGDWVEPNSFQLGGFNSDIKFLTTNQYATAPMTISNANQSVGIGTNAPNRKLTVEANTPSDGVMTVRNASTAGFAGTYFESGDTWDGYVGYVGSGSWVEPNSFQVGANNRDIKFVTTNSTLTAAMTIKTSNQSVGIGNSNPDYKLSVYHGSKGMEIKNTNAGPNSWEFYHDSGTNQLQLRTAAGTSVGHFDYNSGAYLATSDRKLKRNIQPIATILPSIMRLMPVNYHYDTDEDQKKHIGFIAQEVEDVFPELISTPAEDADKDAIYRMNYTGFGVIAIKAIQEQQNIIEEQQEIIEKQQAKLDAIEKALNKAGIYLEE